MNRTSLRPWALILLLGISGCYKASFYQGSTVRGTQHEEWTNFFLFGLVGHDRVDVREFCPNSQVAALRSGGNFGTSLVSVLTVGIYTPRKVYVSCADRSSTARARVFERSLGSNVRKGVEQ
jgi:hypothetical protein